MCLFQALFWKVALLWDLEFGMEWVRKGPPLALSGLGQPWEELPLAEDGSFLLSEGPPPGLDIIDIRERDDGDVWSSALTLRIWEVGWGRGASRAAQW